MARKVLYISALFLLVFISCNSSDYGIFSEVLDPKILKVKIDCRELKKRAVLESGLRITIRAGPRAEGVASLRYVILQVCLHREDEGLSLNKDDLPLINNCSDVYSERIIRGSELGKKCEYIQSICMSSLGLPFDCNDFEKPQNSLCYLKPNQKLKWRGSETISLVSKNEEPFLERSGKFWSKLCCRYSSKDCKDDIDCKGKGSCNNYCLKSGKKCGPGVSCPKGDNCIGFCSTIGKNCERDPDCARGELCLQGKCSPALDIIALSSRLKEPENLFATDTESGGLRILCELKTGPFDVKKCCIK